MAGLADLGIWVLFPHAPGPYPTSTYYTTDLLALTKPSHPSQDVSSPEKPLFTLQPSLVFQPLKSLWAPDVTKSGTEEAGGS